MSQALREDDDEQQRWWQRFVAMLGSEDRAAYEAVWQVISRDVYGMAVLVLHDLGQASQISADDLSQSMLLKLQEPDIQLRLRGSRNPRGYVRSSMRNLAIDLHRRSRVEHKVFRKFLRLRLRLRKPTVSPQRVHRLEQVLTKLSNDERAMVEMRYGLNLSIEEIAQRLNLTYSATGARLCRLKTKIREELDG
jgi:RNA polymerase sigma factor (sigma-70 family)